MKALFFLLTLLLACGLQAQQPQPQLIPYSPNIIQDKKGNEWYIEPNGGLQRNGSQPSMISNAMTLQIGPQQFYSQQPMANVDGSELVLSSPQPMNGLSITRRITILEREGALRYVEEFTNTTSRDVTAPVELRHSFNTQNKAILTDSGRPFKDGLAGDESGLMITSRPEENSPNVLLTLAAPGVQTPPRINARSGHQFSVIYTLTIPAGQTVTLIHAIAQARLGPTPKPEDIAKAFQPIQMRRLTRGLPKNLLQAAANLASRSEGYGLDEWFPARFWDVAPQASDVLVLDDTSRLKGQAAAAPAVLTTTFGEAKIVWENVAALAGPAFTQTDESWLCLRDGQRWQGTLKPQSLAFTLSAGAKLDLPRPNRLILRQPAGAAAPPPLRHALLETWAGERLAFDPVGELKLDTPWGPFTVPWSEVVVISPPDPGSLGGLVVLRNGARISALPAPEPVTLQTKDFGPREFNFAQLRRAITPLAATPPADDAEPTQSFIDLTGDQRLIGRVTSESLRFLTPSGPVDLAPATIRELREADDQDAAGPHATRRFQAEIWGGGTLTGALDNPDLKVEGRGFTWTLPVRHLIRIVNPIPVSDSALLRRTGDLIQSLADPQWKTRERATTELRELGPLAKPSLQEALKQSTDPEVTRRLEQLLSDLE